jgi:CheY-like chemotaxis protein
LVGSILDMNRLLADKKGLKLSEHYSDGLSAFYLGDAARVRQILLNLVGNALKFTSEGEISIRVRPTESKRVRFEVTDSGIGIRPEQIDKLFSAFTQADASTTRQFGGTGLGLSICKKLVDMMGGDIGIDSEYGQGSTFWFELPLVPAKAPEKPVEVSPEMETAPLNILVAEDNLPNQLLVKAILSKLGHQVLVVGNGLEAVQSVETAESPFDVVLMDMQMPEMDGLTATQHIRELPSSRASVPIIALTANALSGDREKVLDAGMNDYLTKPIDVSQLKRLLNVWGTANQRLPGFE